MGDGSVRFVSQNISSNPAAAATGCSVSTAAITGPGYTFQNLFMKNDGYVVGDF